MNQKSFFIVALCVAAVFGAGALPTAGLGKTSATNAFSWSDGLIKYSTITNCVSIIQGTPYQENGVGTYVGFYADASAAQPAPGQVYYIHVVIAGMGNACSGMRAFFDVALPSNTSLAISATNKVNYYYDNVPLPANESPQSLSPSSYNQGAYQVLSVDAANAYTWPIPVGKILEVQIPVISTTALTGSTLQANVWVMDGNDSPWLRPQIGVYVFSTTPSILYSQPSTTNITTTSGHSAVTLYNYGIVGTGYFELGTTTAYGLIRDPVTITSAFTEWSVWDDWGPPALTPGTLYHWRFTFTTSAGTTYYGADQTFTTLPLAVSTSSGTPRINNAVRISNARSHDLQGRIIPAGYQRSAGVVLQRADGRGVKRQVSPGRPQSAQ